MFSETYGLYAAPPSGLHAQALGLALGSSARTVVCKLQLPPQPGCCGIPSQQSKHTWTYGSERSQLC
jgi:hypothetical protein